MIELEEARDIQSAVAIKRAENGYRVLYHRVLKEKKTVMSLFGPKEVQHEDAEMVFPTLADVVQFLGQHYEEPTVGVSL
jgi:hypothetical protein